MTERERFDLKILELRKRLIQVYRRREFQFVKEQAGRGGHSPNADFPGSYFTQINLRFRWLESS